MLPLILAPMAELSHRALRELVESFGGCDLYYSEMISAGGIIGGGQFEKYYLDSEPKPEKLVYQIAGGKPEQLEKAAAILDKNECAGIDINMGCCAPAILKSGAGAAWMNNTEAAAAMTALVRKAVRHHRLSVKLRIGQTDNFDYLLNFCKRLENEGVEQITLHPRTTKEKFKSYARWEYVSMLKKELTIPVAGNGDILTIEELRSKAVNTDCDAVMSGRLAIKQPWCFAAAKNIFSEQKIDLQSTAFLFLELLAKYQPPEFHYSRARRFFHYFCGNFFWAEYLRNAINREKTLSGMEKILKEYFRNMV
ncbi:tRNA-dihydrouridine synthase [Spirochaetia bacterium]|nr:tRNA-dihydrouridine synthase [Spirochaetia bacterium]